MVQKLDGKLRSLIRQRRKKGWTIGKISQRYGVSRTAVWNAIHLNYAGPNSRDMRRADPHSFRLSRQGSQT